ncbi:Ubiquitin-protein ligase E3C, partial [Leucoagaricus sp. SymC.cos]
IYEGILINVVLSGFFLAKLLGKQSFLDDLVVDSFNQEQCIALLMFVTNCSQPLLLAFKKLVPNFSIHDAGPNKPYLSTASTCVNLLKLPPYDNEHILQAKLLQGIMLNVGFNLS